MKVKTNSIKKRNYLFIILSCTVLGVYSLLMIAILGWAFLSSFKHKFDFIEFPTSLFPSSKYGGWHFDNYSIAYLTMHIIINLPQGAVRYVYAEEMLLNSVVWTIGSAFLNTFTTALVAYCCARFSRRKFATIIYFITVFAISIPIIGSLPSQMKILRWLNIYDTYFVIPFMKMSFVSSYFLVFYAIFMKLPTSFREAAEVDGAGHWRIFFQIVLPMVMNTLVAVFILFFISYWNDYSAPMMFMPSKPTIAQGLYDLMNGQSSRNKNLSDATSLAAALLVAIPPIIIFAIFRDKLMTNVTMGGIKG